MFAMTMLTLLVAILLFSWVIVSLDGDGLITALRRSFDFERRKLLRTKRNIQRQADLDDLRLEIIEMRAERLTHLEKEAGLG